MIVFLKEFWLFGLKQAYACMFGGFLLAVMLLTSIWYPIELIHRYDFIFLAAIVFQLLLLAFRFETPREALVIVIFHIVATVMELFKTSDAIGSWVYPEEYIFGIGNVPLFTGFMYSAVGSYIARIWRLFDFQFSVYPARRHTLLLVVLIYINFFAHHFVWDIRWLLLAATFWLFWPTRYLFLCYPYTPKYADFAGMATGSAVYLDCRESGDLCQYLDLSESAGNLGNGTAGQAVVLVSVDATQFRVGHAGE